jgi:hypothetical protein
MALQKNPKKKFLPKSLINGKGKGKTTITFTEFESIQTPFGQAKNHSTHKERERERERERVENRKGKIKK